MLSMYKCFKCKSCGKEFILLAEDVEKLNTGKYIACSFCSSRRILDGKATDDLRDCMKHDSYRREHGYIRQVRHT